MRSEAADRKRNTRAGQCLTSTAATGLEVAEAAFSPLLDVLADVPDPRRAQGQLYKLPHVLLFAILAIVTGCNSYRGVERRRSPDIVTFIDVHRRKLNAAFGPNWRRAPAHTAVRYILQGLDPTGVEAAFRRHAALVQAARATPGKGSVALDGKTLRGSFDKFRDRAAAQVGLVVTSVPKVPIWRACEFNALHRMWRDRRKIGDRNYFRALNGVVSDVCRDCLVSDRGQHQHCF